MDLFASISAPTAASSISISTLTSSLNSTLTLTLEPIRVSIEQIKKRTVTVIYNMDLTLDKSLDKNPKVFLSKLKKSICNSNGFIRAPEDTASESSSEDEDNDEGDSEEEDKPVKPAKPAKPVKPVQTGLAYVINGNHSNTICRYLYGLGVKNIIRTGTA